jgi:peroxiredoxin
MMSVGALSDEAQTTGIQVGELAPDFTLPVVGVDGERVNLYEQIEQYDVILLYYFLAAS